MPELNLIEEKDISLYDIFRDPFKEAAKVGCMVVEPEYDELFIDLDNEEALENFNLQLKKLRDFAATEIIKSEYYPSKSGPPHYHAKVKIYGEYFPDHEWKRLALQVFLGSDLEREKLNILRLFITGQTLNLFFERPLTLVRTETKDFL
jgi:hypothetical protein